MSGVLVSLADGVTAEIAAHNFGGSFAFTPARNWADFDVNLEDNETGLRVDVVPVGHTTVEIVDRQSIHYVTRVDVGLRYKFPAANTQTNTGRIDPAVIDELVLLSEGFIEFLESPAHHRLTSYDDATFASLQVGVLASPTFLRDHRQFLAILRVSYDIYKSLA